MTSQPPGFPDNSGCKCTVLEDESPSLQKINNITKVRPEDGQGFPIVVQDDDISPDKGTPEDVGNFLSPGSCLPQGQQHDDTTVDSVLSEQKHLQPVTEKTGTVCKVLPRDKVKPRPSVQADDDTVELAQPGASDEGEDGKTSENQTVKSSVVGVSHSPTTVDNTRNMAIGQSYNKPRYGQHEAISVSCSKPSLPSRSYPKQDQYLYSPNTVRNDTKVNLKRKLMARTCNLTHLSSSLEVCPSKQEQKFITQVRDNLVENRILPGTLKTSETQKTMMIEKLTGQNTVPIPARELLNGEEDTNSSSTSGASDTVKESLRNKILCKRVKSDQSTNLELGTSHNRKTKKGKGSSKVKKTMKSKEIENGLEDNGKVKEVSIPGPSISFVVSPHGSNIPTAISTSGPKIPTTASIPGPNIPTTVSMPGPNIPTLTTPRPNIPTTVNCESVTDECPSPRKKTKGESSRRK
ncbi:uncharacterized protein LOC123532139 [Mercenaria mercenaria]|uniref:uncharacterized protein LOC123532139 n=1 Tax=Mercenaria mercenaria TaxID=6596 RepID=UPI00234F20EC|nr:uncharacterized protein LOC123532139 [Mercenaria mercenaria]XP_045169433.2 uncharacterized protein LOC123532139 [Mercenaria mercenaria]